MPSWLTISDDFRTFTIKGLSQHDLTHVGLGAIIVTPDPSDGIPYYTTSTVYLHTNEGVATRYEFPLTSCVPFITDQNDEDAIHPSHDVNNAAPTGNGTEEDPFTLFVEPGKDIVNYKVDPREAELFFHYYSFWERPENGTWKKYSTGTLLNVPRSEFKNGDIFRVFLYSAANGGYVYFKVTEVAKFQKKLANTGVEESALLGFAALTMIAAGGALVVLRQRRS